MRKLWLGILGLAAASTANAAVVTFTLSLHESATGTVQQVGVGTATTNGWALYATVSQGDNSGLFAFGVDTKGTGDAGGPTTLTMVNRSPSGTWDADPNDPNYDASQVYPTKFAGYGAGRSTSTATGIVSGVTDLSKGGDLIPVFNIGQAVVKMNDSKPPPDTSTGVPVAYKDYAPAAGSDQNLGSPFNRTGVSGFVTLPAGTVRIATGAYTGNDVNFDLGSVNTKASVWKTSHPNNTENEIAQIVTQIRDFNPTAGNTFTVANTAVGNNLATDGKIVVTGSNNQYSSEVDQLTADLNAGSANVQTIGDEAGTLYVMAQITGTASDVNAVLAQFNNASGSSQAPLLHANYDAQFGPGGFNLLFSMPNFAGAKNINWNFSANTGAVVNELAIVPEPGTISLLGLGALGLLARRRRNA